MQIHSPNRRSEAHMTNRQLVAFIEAIKIINEKSKTPEETKNALDRIQDVLKNSKPT